MSQSPPPIPPYYQQQGFPAGSQPPMYLGALSAGMRVHRGGLILGLGIASLGVWLLCVLGALVFPCCGMSGLISLGMAIPAWVMANADLAAMAAGTMDPSGRGTTQAGKTCAIISVVIHAISVVVTMAIVIVVILAIGGAAAAGAAGHHP